MTALAKLATVATMGCALGLSACVVEHVDAPVAPAQPPPPVVEPAPAVPAVQLPVGIVNGKPGHYKDGGPLAYWIWRDEVGRYHLRATQPAGQKAAERFRGRAAATVGQLANLKVEHAEHRANVNANQAGMVFDFYPKGQNDGFDFDVSDPKACVRFDLNTWGGKTKIVIGTTEQSPTSEHFIVCP